MDFSKKGPDGVPEDVLPVLLLFCAAYSHLLLVLDDEEFYEHQVSLYNGNMNGIHLLLFRTSTPPTQRIGVFTQKIVVFFEVKLTTNQLVCLFVFIFSCSFTFAFVWGLLYRSRSRWINRELFQLCLILWCTAGFCLLLNEETLVL